MKNIKLIVILALFFFGACSEEFTDLTPLGDATSSNFWQSAEDAITAANGLYQHWDDNT